MAEGFANKYLSYKAFSAGTKKSNLDPLAVKVMSEVDIDISQYFSKTFNARSIKFPDRRWIPRRRRVLGSWYVGAWRN